MAWVFQLINLKPVGDLLQSFFEKNRSPNTAKIMLNESNSTISESKSRHLRRDKSQYPTKKKLVDIAAGVVRLNKAMKRSSVGIFTEAA